MSEAEQPRSKPEEPDTLKQLYLFACLTDAEADAWLQHHDGTGTISQTLIEAAKNALVRYWNGEGRKKVPGFISPLTRVCD